MNRGVYFPVKNFSKHKEKAMVPRHIANSKRITRMIVRGLFIIGMLVVEPATGFEPAKLARLITNQFPLTTWGTPAYFEWKRIQDLNL